MNLRCGFLHDSAQLDVAVPSEIGREPGLQAHLGCAHLPRLTHTPCDLVLRKEVTLLRAHAARERAKLAVLDADVREVDVAVDHVGDAIAHLLTAELVGNHAQGVEVPASCPVQGDAIIDAELVAIEASF